MITIHAGDLLAYDSRQEKYDLQGLTVTTGTNKGGAAEITMPRSHPAYNYFVSYRTIVEIRRDGVLRFRGRALYLTDDYHGARTITCEGELCFFQDGVSRPYLHQDTPAAIFAAVVNDYNSQVEDFKQFRVGTCTIEDWNDYLRLESEEAEQSLDTLNKLLERCGGYFTFTTAEDGVREINWLAQIDSRSNQEIEFGENLLDYSSTGANTALITGIIPYGAKDEETGKRVDITSVNGGLDYILAEDAKAIRGTILAPVTWDDVTEPGNLLTKAQEYLQANRYIVTSLELSALDLSYLDKSLDSFRVGDTIRAKSAPHGVDEDFQLTEMTEDLLNPAQSTIKLGKSITPLTTASVQTENTSKTAAQNIQANAAMTVEKQVQAAEQRMTNLFNQTADSIKMEVTGSMGGSASISLTVGKNVQTQILDLSHAQDFYVYENDYIHSCDSDRNPICEMLGYADGRVNVGAPDWITMLRGSTVYLKDTSTTVTSDRNAKNSIEVLPVEYAAFMDKLQPVRFKYNEGTGDRYHVGYIAQDVAAALEAAGLSTQDFAGYVDVGGTGELGLMYDEFVALLHLKIKQLERQLAALTAQ